MIKRFTKHGNSMAIVIDKPIMELLKMTADTQLEFSTDGQSMIFTPKRPKSRKRRFDDAVNETFKNYGRMLKRLAE